MSVDPVEAGRKGGKVRSERKRLANIAHGFKRRAHDPQSPVDKINPELSSKHHQDPITPVRNDLDTA